MPAGSGSGCSKSIRQYAQERLEDNGDTGAVRRLHAGHYVELAETAGPHLRSRDQLTWANTVLRDTDNFRAALDWAVETPSPEHALRLVAPLTMTGMTIGDVAIDLADTASAIPGAEEHPLFPVVAAFASYGATMGSDFERAEALVTVAEHSKGSLGTPHPSVLRARALLALFRGDTEQSQHYAQAWVDPARASLDTYELAHALIMLGSTLINSEPDAAEVALDEAVRVARDARILSALSIGLTILAGQLFVRRMGAGVDPIEERTLALIDESIDVGIQIGDRITVSLSTGSKGWIAARRGEWRIALQAAVDAAEQVLQIGNVVNINQSFDLASAAFCALRHFEPAAVLFGKTDAMFPHRRPPDWVDQILASSRAAIVEAFGEQQVATLAARGAALEFSDVVAYLRAQADLALDED